MQLVGYSADGRVRTSGKLVEAPSEEASRKSRRGLAARVAGRFIVECGHMLQNGVIAESTEASLKLRSGFFIEFCWHGRVTLLYLIANTVDILSGAGEFRMPLESPLHPDGVEPDVDHFAEHRVGGELRMMNQDPLVVFVAIPDHFQ